VIDWNIAAKTPNPHLAASQMTEAQAIQGDGRRWALSMSKHPKICRGSI